MDIKFFIKNESKDISSPNSDDSSIKNIDFSFFTKPDAAKIDASPSVAVEEKKRKPRQPKVTEAVVIDGQMQNPVPGANVAETNYANTYAEATNLLKGAIIQSDTLSNEIKEDIDAIRASKTIKNKYTYITNLTASASSLINTKIQAIKEINSTTTQIHNLELNRLKALKPEEKDGNDDMKMMDIYSAFVNAPIGSYAPPSPSIQDIMVGVNGANPAVSGVEMVPQGGSFTQNLTPEENRMRLESNPNIQVVVRYNQSTGMRSFDVIDRSTGAVVPNYPRPDNFLLEDTTIDVHAGIARNRNINAVWPLLIDGSNSMPINEY